MNRQVTPVAPAPATRFLDGELPPPNDRVAAGLSLLTLVAVLVTGLGLATVVCPPLRFRGPAAAGPVTIRLEATPVPPVVAHPVDPPAEAAAPLLEPDAVLSAPIDKVAPEPAAAPPPRRVYGVRRVFARGLGNGDGEAGRLVTRHGNTLDGASDTLTATAADVAGGTAALSTIDKAPVPIHEVKPDYSTAMRHARTEGVVAAELLVDAEGLVKDVKVLADPGQDSGDVAATALRRFRFRPAQRQGRPVAVRIIYHVRFELQE